MTKDQSPGQDEESEHSRESISASFLSKGLSFYEDIDMYVSPTSENEESLVAQTREDDFILSLRTLNCSPELLESVQKFLS